MQKLEWKDEYSVGVALIDEQHKMFVGIMNELYSAIVEKKEKTVIDDVFKQLVAYTQFHFQTEERYFDEFKYEGAQEHKEAHAKLRHQIAELEERKDGIFEDPFLLMDFLEDWLVNHIMGMDKQYGPCFREHGLE